MTGNIERGVLTDLGITEPRTALEATALKLAQLLDSSDADAKTAAAISRELRLTMLAIANAPADEEDKADEIASRCREE